MSAYPKLPRNTINRYKPRGKLASPSNIPIQKNLAHYSDQENMISKPFTRVCDSSLVSSNQISQTRRTCLGISLNIPVIISRLQHSQTNRLQVVNTVPVVHVSFLTPDPEDPFPATIPMVCSSPFLLFPLSITSQEHRAPRILLLED